MTRFAPRSLQAAPARATAFGSPEMTVWSGAFRLAATTTSPPVEAARHAASTSLVASPSTAAIVPGRSVPACCISSPRRRTSTAASVGVNAPAVTYAEDSPREWPAAATAPRRARSEEHTSELQSRLHLVCRLLLEKKKQIREPIQGRVRRNSAAHGFADYRPSPDRLPTAHQPDSKGRARESKLTIKDVVEVRPLGGHRLYLKFDDGVHGEVDVAQFVRFDGVFEELRDPARFAEVRVDPDLGTICWPNGADLAPDMLYAKITGRSLPA